MVVVVVVGVVVVSMIGSVVWVVDAVVVSVVVVEVPSVVVSVAVTPSSSMQTQLETVQHYPEARHAKMDPIAGVMFTWTSDDPDVATVDQT